MTRGRGIYDDDRTEERNGGRPEPKDEDREGGMATREVTPDVAETDQEPTG